MSLEHEIAKLQSTYQTSSEKDQLYQELLNEYEKAKRRIDELEEELKKQSISQLPSKDEVESMSSMLDLISKLDETTIEKLSKFGGK